MRYCPSLPSLRSLTRLRLTIVIAVVLAATGSARAADLDAAQLRRATSILPALSVGSDPRFGSARVIANRDGFLTQDHGRGGLLGLGTPVDDTHAPVLALVHAYGALFGDAALLDHAVRVEREWQNPLNGLSTVIWVQEIDGIPVQGAHFIAHLTRANALVDIGNSCVPLALQRAAAAHRAGAPQPTIPASEAVRRVLSATPLAAATATPGDPLQACTFTVATSSGAVTAHLVWAMRGDALTLAWEVVACEPPIQEAFASTVDALDGTPLNHRSITTYYMSPARSRQIAQEAAARGGVATPVITTTTPAVVPLPLPLRAPRPSVAAHPTDLAQSVSGTILRAITGMSQPFTLAVFAPISVVAVTPNDPQRYTIEGESPTPFVPGYAAPVANPNGTAPNISTPPPGAPASSYPVGRIIYTQSGPTPQSPNGWIDDGNTSTMGNNIIAYVDPQANDAGTPTQGTIGVNSGGPGRNFQPLVTLTGDPQGFDNDAATVNLFYWTNFMHDRLYSYGFTEAAGNFQTQNFTGQGIGGDAVHAESQQGSAVGLIDNANFQSQGDGTPAFIRMYLFNSASPGFARRDGDFDATVMCHEYTHGLSTRMVGGGAALNTVQSAGMGEGWSDFVSTTVTSPDGTDVNAAYPQGGYVSLNLLQNINFQNYYQAIRRFPYSTDLGVSPLTFAKNADLVNYPNLGAFTDAQKPYSNNEVHNQGEIWCNTLLQARANWITRYAGSGPQTDPIYQAAWRAASDRFMTMFVDSLGLTPPNPSYIDARDAILRADQVDNAGANQDILWQAFAKRGLGPAAEVSQPEDTQVIQDLNPVSSFVVIGGTFYAGGQPAEVSTSSQSSTTYTLRSLGAVVNWTASASQSWITLTPSSGSIPAGGSMTVTASCNTGADQLALGDYTGTITFSPSGGSPQTRSVLLDVAGTYIATAAPYLWLTPQNPIQLNLTDDQFQSVPIGFGFTFYGRLFRTLQVGSNGQLTFSAPTPNDAAHSAFNVPLGGHFPIANAICPLWFDLNPDFGGTISYGVIGTAPFRVLVVTWAGIAPAFNGYLNYAGSIYPPVTFQAQLSESTNVITFAYQELQPTQFWGKGALATVGVEDDRAILFTQWQAPQSVSINNATALRFSYSQDHNLVNLAIANATDGGTGQCGIGFGLPGLIVGALYLGWRRARRR